MTHCVSFPPCAISPFLHKLQRNPPTRMIVVRFNPQVLNSCGLHYGSIFFGHVFPSAVESESHIFPLLVPSLLLPFATAASPTNSVNTRTLSTAVVVSLLCAAEASETFSFMYSLQHVRELLLTLTQRGTWAAKKQGRGDLCCLRPFFFFFLLSLSHPRTSFMATSVFTGLTAALLLRELRQ